MQLRNQYVVIWVAFLINSASEGDRVIVWLVGVFMATKSFGLSLPFCVKVRFPLSSGFISNRSDPTATLT